MDDRRLILRSVIALLVFWPALVFAAGWEVETSKDGRTRPAVTFHVHDGRLYVLSILKSKGVAPADYPWEMTVYELKSGKLLETWMIRDHSTIWHYFNGHFVQRGRLVELEKGKVVDRGFERSKVEVIVGADQIYTLSRHQRVLSGVDEKGKRRWRRAIPELFPTLPREVFLPTRKGLAVGGEVGTLTFFDGKRGKPRWSFSLPKKLVAATSNHKFRVLADEKKDSLLLTMSEKGRERSQLWLIDKGKVRKRLTFDAPEASVDTELQEQRAVIAERGKTRALIVRLRGPGDKISFAAVDLKKFKLIRSEAMKVQKPTAYFGYFEEGDEVRDVITGSAFKKNGRRAYFLGSGVLLDTGGGSIEIISARDGKSSALTLPAYHGCQPAPPGIDMRGRRYPLRYLPYHCAKNQASKKGNHATVGLVDLLKPGLITVRDFGPMFEVKLGRFYTGDSFVLFSVLVREKTVGDDYYKGLRTFLICHELP